MRIQSLFMISAILLAGISFHANARGLKHNHHGLLPTQIAKPEEKKELEKSKVADNCSRNPKSCSESKNAGLAESENRGEPELIRIPQG